MHEGFRPEAVAFFIFLLNLLTTTFAACGIAFVIGASVASVGLANLFIALCYVFMMVGVEKYYYQNVIYHIHFGWMEFSRMGTHFIFTTYLHLLGMFLKKEKNRPFFT